MSDDTPLGVQVTGYAAPATPPRPAAAWLKESLSLLALIATRDTYAAQPALWDLGENGRARTIEDFEHHLRAAMGTERQWHDHLAYCLSLFSQRGFPMRWLTEAFVTLDRVIAENLPADVAAEICARLAQGPERLHTLAAEQGVEVNAPTRYDD